MMQTAMMTRMVIRVLARLVPALGFGQARWHEPSYPALTNASAPAGALVLPLISWVPKTDTSRFFEEGASHGPANQDQADQEFIDERQVAIEHEPLAKRKLSRRDKLPDGDQASDRDGWQARDQTHAEPAQQWRAQLEFAREVQPGRGG